MPINTTLQELKNAHECYEANKNQQTYNRFDDASLAMQKWFQEAFSYGRAVRILMPESGAHIVTKSGFIGWDNESWVKFVNLDGFHKGCNVAYAESVKSIGTAEV